MAPSAREHYYSKIAPEENWQNYQRVHQGHHFEGDDDADIVRVYSHVPAFSNDLLIEQYVIEMRDLVAPAIAKRLDNLFVAKRRKFFANAGALHAKEEYKGDLIFFYVGLSDVLFQYATLYQEFYTLVRAREALGDDSSETRSLFRTLYRDIQKLCNAQLEWGGGNRNEIRFKEETVLVPGPEHERQAVSIATLMDKAVLRHEVAHHLLGHTSYGSGLSTELRVTIERFLKHDRCSAEHAREFEADICSIFLPASRGRHESFDQLGFEVAFGTLMTQTVLAQLSASIHLDSATHPSWKSRNQLSIEALRHFYPVPGCRFAISEVSRFQALMYLVQKRGLGELTIDQYEIESRTDKECHPLLDALMEDAL